MVPEFRNHLHCLVFSNKCIISAKNLQICGIINSNFEKTCIIFFWNRGGKGCLDFFLLREFHQFLRMEASLRKHIITKSLFSFGHCPKRGGGCPNILALSSSIKKLVHFYSKLMIFVCSLSSLSSKLPPIVFFSVIRAKRRFDVRKKDD